jgi:predicted transcriptional regulator
MPERQSESGTCAFQCRLPIELHARLKEVAKLEERSMRACALRAIQAYCDDD